MPECARCNAFTDVEPDVDYRYCDTCLEHFSEIDANGVVVVGGKEKYTISIPSDVESPIQSGEEYSQVDALARAKLICNETGLRGLFRYEPTGSCWPLDEYLENHHSVRQDVNDRLRRHPEVKGSQNPGIIDRIKALFQ